MWPLAMQFGSCKNMKAKAHLDFRGYVNVAWRDSKETEMQGKQH